VSRVHYALPVCEGDFVTDANSIRLGSNPAIANVDIVISSEILSGRNAKCDVKAAGCVANERMGTIDSIKVPRRVRKKRDITVGRVVVASCIAKQRAYSNCGIVESSSVAKERIKPGSYVQKPTRVVIKRTGASSCILRAGGVAEKCTTTKRRVTLPGREALEREISFSCVAIGIASVWWRTNSAHHWRQCKTRERHENKPASEKHGIN